MADVFLKASQLLEYSHTLSARGASLPDLSLVFTEPPPVAGEAAVLLLFGEDGDRDRWLARLARTKGARTLFIVVVSLRAATSPSLRLALFRGGVRMVTNTAVDLAAVLAMLHDMHHGGGNLECPFCAFKGLTEDGLHLHLPLFHCYEDNPPSPPCPVCVRDGRVSRRGDCFYVHYHNRHGPVVAREPPMPAMACFSLGVVRSPLTGQFLLCHEPFGIGGGYWLPAGRVDCGETLTAACLREVHEEAGVSVRITGLLTLTLHGTTVRAYFLAEPVPTDLEHLRLEEAAALPCKTLPDFESCGAVWATCKEVLELNPKKDFRGSEPVRWYPAVESGAAIAHSIDTEAFTRFEQTVQALTVPTRVSAKEYEQLEAGMLRAWEDLKGSGAYPKELFVEND